MNRRVYVLASITFLLASNASADSLNTLLGDATWHSFQAPSTAQVANNSWGPARNIVPGTAFWNNWSIDGRPNHECNIGYWVSGTGGCTALNSVTPSLAFLSGNPGEQPAYLGDGTTGFSFTPDASGSSVDVTLRVQVSAFANAGLNEFGWFNVATPARLNPLFGGTVLAPASTPTGAVATFVPSGDYGFYLKSPSGTYLSTGAGDTRSHFAVFQLAGIDRFVLGLEDMNDRNLADWDFNDAAVEIQVHQVPEPGSLLLLGTGLVGLLAKAGRRRRG